MEDDDDFHDDFHLVDHEPDSFDLDIKRAEDFDAPTLQATLQEELLKCKDTIRDQAAAITLLQNRVVCQETAIANYTVQYQESMARLEMERMKCVNVVKYLQDKTAELKVLSNAKSNTKADQKIEETPTGPEGTSEGTSEGTPNEPSEGTSEGLAPEIETVLHSHEATLAHVLANLSTKAADAEASHSKCQAFLSTVQQETKQSVAQLKTDRDRFRHRSTQLEEELNRKVYELNTLRRSRPLDHVMFAAQGPPRAFMQDLFDPKLFR